MLLYVAHRCTSCLTIIGKAGKFHVFLGVMIIVIESKIPRILGFAQQKPKAQKMTGYAGMEAGCNYSLETI
jgi:hypothetical protein